MSAGDVTGQDVGHARDAAAEQAADGYTMAEVRELFVETLLEQELHEQAAEAGGRMVSLTPEYRDLFTDGAGRLFDAMQRRHDEQVRAAAWEAAIALLRARRDEFVGRYADEPWDRGFAGGLESAMADIANHWHRTEQAARSAAAEEGEH